MICTMNFISLYRFILFQYHGPLFQYHEPKQYHEPSIPWAPFSIPWAKNYITSDIIPGRGYLDESLPNTMGQYHGGYPWFFTLWALFPIRDLARCFPCAYATSPRKIRVCLETYSFHHRSSTYWIHFFITFCNFCRYIRFSSLNRFIKTYSIKHNFIK